MIGYGQFMKLWIILDSIIESSFFFFRFRQTMFHQHFCKNKEQV
jgi:hypothetical protein